MDCHDSKTTNFILKTPHKAVSFVNSGARSKDSLGIKIPAGHSLDLELHFICSRLLIVKPSVRVQILGCTTQIKTPPNGGVWIRGASRRIVNSHRKAAGPFRLRLEPWVRTPCYTWINKKCRTRRHFLLILAHPEGFEPSVFWSVVRCFIQLSYGCNGFIFYIILFKLQEKIIFFIWFFVFYDKFH